MLLKERIQRLLKDGQFKCEFFEEKRDPSNYFYIDPTNTCCTILEIFDDKIKVSIDGNDNGKLLQKFINTDNIKVEAVLRALVIPNALQKYNNKKYHINLIIAFDIVAQTINIK